MNANFTREPTPTERGWAEVVSEKARGLVVSYGSEVADNQEFPNEGNVARTRTHLLAYIAQLEANAQKERIW